MLTYSSLAWGLALKLIGQIQKYLNKSLRVFTYRPRYITKAQLQKALNLKILIEYTKCGHKYL
jgi:hypothetical protein